MREGHEASSWEVDGETIAECWQCQEQWPCTTTRVCDIAAASVALLEAVEATMHVEPRWLSIGAERNVAELRIGTARYEELAAAAKKLREAMK
jgi:hypothetical protein